MRRRRAVLSAWFAVAGLLVLPPLSAPVAGAETLRDLARALHSREPDERERAARQLGERPGPQSVMLLLPALSDDEPEVREAVRAALRKRRTPDELSLISSRGLRHLDRRVRAAALDLLAESRFPGLPEVLTDLLADRDPEIVEAAVGLVPAYLRGRGKEPLAAALSRRREARPRAAALLALAEVDPDEARSLAGRLVRDPEMEVRVASLEILAGGGAEGVPATLAALRDESWSVRLAAIRILSDSGLPEAVVGLIEALERETGRLEKEAGEALCGLTGVGLPPDPRRWRDWWAEAESTYRPPERKARAPEPMGESVTTFHSIPFRSRCVAFVLDRSRSMRDRIDRGEERRKGDLVEEELSNTLGRIRTPTRFFLVAFGTEPEAFHKRPVPATAGARAKALEWFTERPARGRTNLHDSLRMALEVPEVDTIFLLTDGAPSAGEEISRTRLRDAVARLNRYHQAVIHTVEIGGEATGRRWRGFLAELARENGGKHVRR